MDQDLKMKARARDQLAVNSREKYATHSVTSKDGTLIGYRQLGYGPGVVLVQGAMGTALNFMELAGALANTFTVYVPDRRGRGLSPLPYDKNYTIQKDVEDLDALLTKTGTHSIFGLSSGALISLQATLTLPAVHKAAIYEPPLFVNGVPTALVRRYEKEMDEGRLAAALITAMQATQMGPAIFNFIPRWLLERLTNRMMIQEDNKATSADATMRMLAPTLRYDFHLVGEMNGKVERFKAINAEVLLLGGSKSPAFLKGDLDALEKVLPHVTRIEFPGLGHSAAWNYDRQRNPDGDPERVAQELCRFFVE
jgi:pimeloyl-ACP methyl ester carboxylesterase